MESVFSNLSQPVRDPAALDRFLRRFFPMKEDLLLVTPSSSLDDSDSDSESVSLESEDIDSKEDHISF